MQESWTIADPEKVNARFWPLMRNVRRSDPLAIIEVFESADGGCTYASPHPNVNWTAAQRTAFAEEIVAQLPILAVQARAGDATAYRALSLAQDSGLLREFLPTIYDMASGLLAELEDPSEMRIRALFMAAMTGDDLAAKAAIDMCLRIGDADVADPGMLEYLPLGMSRDDLEAVIERYNRQAVVLHLPQLMQTAFGDN